MAAIFLGTPKNIIYQLNQTTDTLPELSTYRNNENMSKMSKSKMAAIFPGTPKNIIYQLNWTTDTLPEVCIYRNNENMSKISKSKMAAIFQNLRSKNPNWNIFLQTSAIFPGSPIVTQKPKVTYKKSNLKFPRTAFRTE